MALHAQPRATKDLDLFIRSDMENGKALYAALADFGAPLSDLKPEDLVEPGAFFRMGAAPIMVEIFSRIDGVDFDQAWPNRVEVVVDKASGLKAIFISRDDLVRSKLAVGRHIDLADVDAIRAAIAEHGASNNRDKPPEG